MYHGIPLRQKVITMLAVMTSLFLVALDQTIVSTALSAIVEEFKSFSSLSWVVTAYLLGSTVTVPIAGKLSDLFGRRLILLIGIAIFTITSLFSGSATTINQLIVARALQGVGGGIIMANAFTIIGDLFSPRERGRWQGFIGSAFAIASVAGPLLGGFLTDGHILFGLETNWRWNFWLNVPIGIFAFLVVAIFSPRIKHDHKPIVDYLGAFSLTVALSSFILAFDNTEKIFKDLIESGISLILIKTSLSGLAILFTVIFIFIERKAEEPIIPLNFFKNHTFSIVMAVAALFGSAFLGAIIYLTQFNMQVFGVSATKAGLMLLPMIFSITFSSTAIGILVTKTGYYKKFFVFGLTLATVGVYLLTFLGTETPYFAEAFIMVLVGLGLGTGMPIMNLAVQNEFKQRDLGVATASSQLFRGLGSTVGIAVFGAMLSAGLSFGFSKVDKVTYLDKIIDQPEVYSLVLNQDSTDAFIRLNNGDMKELVAKNYFLKLENSNLSEEEKELAKENFSKIQADFGSSVNEVFVDSLKPLFLMSAIIMMLATLVASGLREKKLLDNVDAPGVMEG